MPRRRPERPLYTSKKKCPRPKCGSMDVDYTGHDVRNPLAQPWGDLDPPVDQLYVCKKCGRTFYVNPSAGD